jgi:hypothetical protein
MRYINFITAFFSFLYCRNWWEGCEEVSFLDKIYKRRVGISTAYELSKHWLTD